MHRCAVRNASQYAWVLESLLLPCFLNHHKDWVNPRGMRHVGLSSMLLWIDVTGCGWVSVHLTNLIKFCMLRTQPSEAQDGLISELKPAVRLQFTVPPNDQMWYEKTVAITVNTDFNATDAPAGLYANLFCLMSSLLSDEQNGGNWFHSVAHTHLVPPSQHSSGEERTLTWLLKGKKPDNAQCVNTWFTSTVNLLCSNNIF